MGFNFGALAKTITQGTKEVVSNGARAAVTHPVYQGFDELAASFRYGLRECPTPNIEATIGRLEKAENTWGLLTALPHINTATYGDAAEFFMSQSITKFIKPTLYNADLMRTLGTKGYIDLLKATTPNPVKAVNKFTQSIFSRLQP